MRIRFRVFVMSVLAVFTLAAAGCGNGAGLAGGSGSSGQPSAEHPQRVLIGIRQDLFPTSYIDESGQPAGYDVEIIKKIDELLPQYEFEYEAVSQEALLTGLQSGKYKAAVAGFYDSKARRDTYIFPKECIGGNLIGLTVLKENANIKNLEKIHDMGKTIAPIATTSGMYGIVVEYNKAHPDKQVQLVNSDWNDVATEFKWILDKRFDALVSSKNVFDQSMDKLGYKDQLVFNGFTAIKTWSLFNPDEKELADAYDGALKQLKDNGFVSRISVKYFGEDVLPYIKDQ